MADTTTVQDDALDADDDEIDSAFEETAGSDTDTLRSSVLNYRVENGRRYHAYHDGAYPFPNDALENNRLDSQHEMFILTFDGKLHQTPIPEPHVGRVLDAGTGTGIWAVEFADNHPESRVTGIDLSPVQSEWVPPNLEYIIDDLNYDWDFCEPFSYIYVRHMTGSISDWPKFMTQAYNNLTPGGFIELTDLIYPVTCDDGTISKESALWEWSQLFLEAMETSGKPINSALLYETQLVTAGFEEIRVEEFKWPSNAWPKDPYYKQLGVMNLENMLTGLSGFSLAALTRSEFKHSFTRARVEVLLANVRHDLRNKGIHAYWKGLVVYAKKPVVSV